MLSEHERYYGFSMDALVIVCSWNTNVILNTMVTMVEVLGCTREAVVLFSITPLRAHLALKSIVVSCPEHGYNASICAKSEE